MDMAWAGREKKTCIERIENSPREIPHVKQQGSRGNPSSFAARNLKLTTRLLATQNTRPKTEISTSRSYTDGSTSLQNVMSTVTGES